MLRFGCSLTVSEGLDEVSHSYFIQKHLAEGAVQLDDVVQTAADGTSETLVFGCVETVYQHHQGVYLCKFLTHLFGLGCYVFYRFAAVYSHYLVFGLIFEDFQ